MSKINICTDFIEKNPFWWWYQSVPTTGYFKNVSINKIKFVDAEPLENNYILLYLLPNDITLQFLENQEKIFYDNILLKNFKIIFLNQGLALFHADRDPAKFGSAFDHSYIDIKQHPYWKICNIFQKHGINEEKLFFIHSADGFTEEIQELRQRTVKCINSTIGIKSKHIQLPLYLTWGQNISVTVENQISYHYSCLYAGRPAVHRQNLIKSLWQKKLLQYGKCSYRRVPDTPYFIDDLIYDKKINLTDDINYSETSVFRDIFLWVAGETYIPQGYPFFTEKTIKAILYERPFISYGEPGILKYLRSFGFKTFSNWWDESYDDIKDDDVKIEKISLIVQDLCKKDITEINKMYADMRPILQHNKKLLQETDWVGKIIEFLS